MLTIYKRKLYVYKALISNVKKAVQGFRCGNYQEEILKGSYVEGFSTNKGLTFFKFRF